MKRAVSVFLCLMAMTVQAGEFVEFGEYLSTATTYQGKRGVFSGSKSDMVFRGDNGEILWSSRGGWVSGAQRQRRPAEMEAIRNEMRRRKQEEDRLVRQGRKSVSYGEYVSRGTTFHGYRGHWSGNNQNQVFVSSEYGIIYSSRGGWVDGFGPEFQASRAVWGAGISDEAQVYGEISDPNTIRRVTHLKPNQVYLVVERTRRFLTVSYYAGHKVVLSNNRIPNKAIVPGHMLGKSGYQKTQRFQFVDMGRGYRFDPK